MKRRTAVLGLVALAGGGQAAEAPPVAVDAIVWLVSNTMAVPDGETTRRPADELTQWLQARLPGVAFKPVIANAERSWVLIRRQQRVCHAGAARTAERERQAYFTNTWLVPRPQLIVRRDRRDVLPLDSQGAVDLPALLADTSLRGSVPQGQLRPGARRPACGPCRATAAAASVRRRLWQPVAADDRAGPGRLHLRLSQRAGGPGQQWFGLRGAGRAARQGRARTGHQRHRLPAHALGSGGHPPHRRGAGYARGGAAMLRDTQRAYADAWDAFFRQRSRPTPGL